MLFKAQKILYSIPILQIKKLRVREVEQLKPGGADNLKRGLSDSEMCS